MVFSAFTASAERSACNAVTNTLACARSRVTSTSETLTDGRPCSRTAECTIAPSSRRSWAETRSVRWNDLPGMSIGASLQRALDLDAFEALDLVARLHVVVRLHADTALGALADFVDV